MKVDDFDFQVNLKFKMVLKNISTFPNKIV